MSCCTNNAACQIINVDFLQFSNQSNSIIIVKMQKNQPIKKKLIVNIKIIIIYWNKYFILLEKRCSVFRNNTAKIYRTRYNY